MISTTGIHRLISRPEKKENITLACNILTMKIYCNQKLNRRKITKTMTINLLTNYRVGLGFP